MNRLLVTTGKPKSVALLAPTDGTQDIWHRKDLDKGLMYVFMEFLTEQKERLVNLFNSMDKDKSGTITRLEFKNGMQALGIPGTDKQLNELIEELDTNGDGDIDYKVCLAPFPFFIPFLSFLFLSFLFFFSLLSFFFLSSSTREFRPFSWNVLQELSMGRAKQVIAIRRNSRENLEAAAAAAAAAAAVKEVVVEETPHLTLDWTEFVTLVVHCHYITRP